MRIEDKLFRGMQIIAVSVNSLFLPFGLYYTHIFGAILISRILFTRKVFMLFCGIILFLMVYFVIGYWSGKIVYIEDYVVNVLLLVAGVLYSIYICIYGV